MIGQCHVPSNTLKARIGQSCNCVNVQPSREQEGAIQAQKIAMELLAAEEEEKARKLKKKEKRSKAKQVSALALHRKGLLQ